MGFKIRVRQPLPRFAPRVYDYLSGHTATVRMRFAVCRVYLAHDSREWLDRNWPSFCPSFLTPLVQSKEVGTTANIPATCQHTPTCKR